jgi:hypothetical protein
MADRPAVDPPSSVRERLLAADPYEDFPLHDWQLDLQGWGSGHPLFGELIGLLRPALIVEVGTWKGASAIHMAREAKRRGVPTEIICVDTWLGSAETLVRRDGSFRDLRHLHGYPQLYFQFLANVLHEGVEDTIVPLPQTSENAARALEKLGIRPYLVYLDASHDGRSVERDLEAWFPLLSDTGALIGDDFVEEQRPDLVRAVRGFADQRGLEVHSDREKFVLARDPGLLQRLRRSRDGWRRAKWTAGRVRGRLLPRR